ncbi:MAG: Maf family protein [Candidatus Omnitrophica bacterium]|nr:Maf family protein [Candidatus Omnitrophota bacterium]
MKQTLILASQSKRRAQILKSCGIRHKIIVSGVSEKFHRRLHPKELVLHNAREKAKSVAKKLNSGIVLGCDTLVLFKSQPIGKPKNVKYARKMLECFSGKKISVYTGLCLIDVSGAKQAQAVAKSQLWVSKIPPQELDRFLPFLGPYDKAGGFSIEGAGSIIFDNIRGSYFNILGLPMYALAVLFRKIGLNILDFMHKR